jgi:WD40 repeat protein
VTIWNIETKAQIQKLIGHAKECWALAKINDEWLASGSEDETIKIWNHTAGRLLKNLTGHNNAVYGLTCLKNNNNYIVVSCSKDKTIRIWDTVNEDKIHDPKVLLGHENSVNCVTLISKHMIVSASWDKTILMWNLTSGKYMKTLSRDVDVVNCLLLLDNRTQLASGDRDFLIKIWNIENAHLIANLEGHTRDIMSLVNLRKGHLASASLDMTIKVWNYESLEYGAALVVTLQGHFDYVYGLILLSDGNLASVSWDQTVKFWNLLAVYNYPNRSVLVPVDL